MALKEQLDIFRAYVLLLAEPDAPLAPVDALDQLAAAVREGEGDRLARELGHR